MLLTIVIVLVAVWFVGLLVWTFVLRRGLVRQEFMRDKGWASTRANQVELAGRHGWTVVEQPGDRAWPESLTDARGDRRRCLLAIVGPDFEATTWQGNEKMVGAGSGLRSRLWLLTLKAPHVRTDLFVVRAPHHPEQAAVLPRRFADRVEVQGEDGLYAGGDFTAARPRLEPMLDSIASSGSWVVTEPGAVHVVATLDPDASGFEWRVDLARKVAAALS